MRLTDPARVLVEHAEALLERAARAEADLAAASNTVGGRVRIATFQSVALRIVLPAMEALAADGAQPALRVLRGRARAGAAGTRDRRRRHRDRRPLAAPAVAAAARPRAPRAAARPGPARAAATDHPAARHDAVPLGELRDARLDDGPRRDGVGGDDPAHVPPLRRLRARHPPPHQRRHGQPRARRARPGGHAAARPGDGRRVIPASRCARSPTRPIERAIPRGHARRRRHAALRAVRCSTQLTPVAARRPRARARPTAARRTAARPAPRAPAPARAPRTRARGADAGSGERARLRASYAARRRPHLAERRGPAANAIS